MLTQGHCDGFTSERRHLADALAHLDEVQRHVEMDLESALLAVNATSVASVPGAKYAGLTVIGDHRQVSTLAATSPIARALDDVQCELGEGPCLSAAWSQHTIMIEDMETETRWPRYCAQALNRTPVRSILSFRLREEGHAVAALNFFAETAGVFDDESVELGLLYAAHTAVAWTMLRREEQFQSALASRDVIGQAKGMLMERFDIDAVAAFELLRKLSQDSNTKLVDVATRLVSGNHHGPRADAGG